MTAPLVSDINQAAQRLGGGFTVDWLRNHLDQIPHVRTGGGTGRAGRIGFTEDHLRRIVEQFTIEPGSLRPDDDLTPLTRRGRRAS